MMSNLQHGSRFTILHVRHHLLASVSHVEILTRQARTDKFKSEYQWLSAQDHRLTLYIVSLSNCKLKIQIIFTFSFPSAELFALSFNFISLCRVSKIFSRLVSLSNIYSQNKSFMIFVLSLPLSMLSLS